MTKMVLTQHTYTVWQCDFRPTMWLQSVQGNGGQLHPVNLRGREELCNILRLALRLLCIGLSTTAAMRWSRVFRVPPLKLFARWRRRHLMFVACLVLWLSVLSSLQYLITSAFIEHATLRFISLLDCYQAGAEATGIIVRRKYLWNMSVARSWHI